LAFSNSFQLQISYLSVTVSVISLVTHPLIFPQEYEQLAAQLNGAKTELKDKVQVISQAAAKEKIVKQAEEHAENMYKLAKDLQE